MIGVSNVPNIWHLAHLRELMIVLLGCCFQFIKYFSLFLFDNNHDKLVHLNNFFVKN